MNNKDNGLSLLSNEGIRERVLLKAKEITADVSKRGIFSHDQTAQELFEIMLAEQISLCFLNGCGVIDIKELARSSFIRSATEVEKLERKEGKWKKTKS